MTGEIGVVGSGGDLGLQLNERILSAGFETVCFDPKGAKYSSAGSVAEVVGRSALVHWCAPYETITDEPLPWGSGTEVVFHNSVMHGSLTAARAIRSRSESGRESAPFTSIVHMLMNEYDTVVVARGHCSMTVRAHLEKIELKPLELSIRQHDEIMAISQAPMAMLCDTILPLLQEVRKELLTPSGMALLTALEDRSARWTAETRRILATNPQLPALTDELVAHVKAMNV